MDLEQKQVRLEITSTQNPYYKFLWYDKKSVGIYSTISKALWFYNINKRFILEEDDLPKVAYWYYLLLR